MTLDALTNAESCFGGQNHLKPAAYPWKEKVVQHSQRVNS